MRCCWLISSGQVCVIYIQNRENARSRINNSIAKNNYKIVYSSNAFGMSVLGMEMNIV